MPRKIETHLTTLKLSPRVSSGLRLMAALKGTTTAKLAEEAVRIALKSHNRKATRLPRKPVTGRTGRPGPTLQEAARAVAKLKPTRNDAIPTRLSSVTAREIEKLALDMNTRMGHLAEEAALSMLSRPGTPKMVRDIAGLGGKRAYGHAKARIERLASGTLQEKAFIKMVDPDDPKGARLSPRVKPEKSAPEPDLN